MPPSQNIKKLVSIFGIIVLLWISLLRLPDEPSFGLDASYAYTTAYFWKHQLHAGIDYIFTYGPLAALYLGSNHYDPDLFGYMMLWALSFGFIFAVVVALTATLLPNTLEKGVFMGLAAVIFAFKPFLDSLHQVIILMMTVLALTPPKVFNTTARHVAGLVMLMVVFACLSLAKFSYFMLATGCVVAIFTALWYRQTSRHALLFLLSYLLILLGVWMLVGEPLRNFATFFINSLSLALGYDDGMFAYGYASADIPAPLLTELYLAVLILGLILLRLLFNLIFGGFRVLPLMTTGVLIFGIFLVWKSGFVRHDAHAIQFFPLALFVAFLFPRPQFKSYQQLTGSLAVLLIAVPAFAGIFISNNAHNMKYLPDNFIGFWNVKFVSNLKALMFPEAYQARLQQALVNLKAEYQLPKIKAAVKDSTIDIFPPIQAIAMLNDLNYHPRPVFQGYQAYNEFLDINGLHYLKGMPPEFVLFEIRPIDGRMPLMEDSVVVQALLKDYQPFLREDRFILLKRQPRSQQQIIETIAYEDNIRLGDTVKLSHHKTVFLALDIKTTLIGGIMEFLYKPPAVYIELTTTHAQKYVYKLVPAMTSRNILINPVIHNESDWYRWAEGRPMQKIAAIKVFLKKPELGFFYQDAVRVRISHSDITPIPPFNGALP